MTKTRKPSTNDDALNSALQLARRNPPALWVGVVPYCLDCVDAGCLSDGEQSSAEVFPGLGKCGCCDAAFRPVRS